MTNKVSQLEQLIPAQQAFLQEDFRQCLELLQPFESTVDSRPPSEQIIFQHNIILLKYLNGQYPNPYEFIQRMEELLMETDPIILQQNPFVCYNLAVVYLHLGRYSRVLELLTPHVPKIKTYSFPEWLFRFKMMTILLETNILIGDEDQCTSLFHEMQYIHLPKPTKDYEQQWSNHVQFTHRFLRFHFNDLAFISSTTYEKDRTHLINTAKNIPPKLRFAVETLTTAKADFQQKKTVDSLETLHAALLTISKEYCPIVMNNIGRIHRKLQHPALAATWFLAALEEGNQLVSDSLDHKEGSLSFFEAVDRSCRPAIVLNLAKALFVLREYESAFYAFKEAILSWPDDPLLWERLGECAIFVCSQDVKNNLVDCTTQIASLNGTQTVYTINTSDRFARTIDNIPTDEAEARSYLMSNRTHHNSFLKQLRESQEKESAEMFQFSESADVFAYGPKVVEEASSENPTDLPPVQHDWVSSGTLSMDFGIVCLENATTLALRSIEEKERFRQLKQKQGKQGTPSNTIKQLLAEQQQLVSVLHHSLIQLSYARLSVGEYQLALLAAQQFITFSTNHPTPNAPPPDPYLIYLATLYSGEAYFKLNQVSAAEKALTSLSPEDINQAQQMESARRLAFDPNPSLCLSRANYDIADMASDKASADNDNLIKIAGKSVVSLLPKQPVTQENPTTLILRTQPSISGHVDIHIALFVNLSVVYTLQRAYTKAKETVELVLTIAPQSPAAVLAQVFLEEAIKAEDEDRADEFLFGVRDHRSMIVERLALPVSVHTSFIPHAPSLSNMVNMP
ncbi:hypothetical protein BLNAU_199 [Blattamonas nauphoetae]|uniref:CCR4-NOT transcription complex subunit 10 n=1 Tax=Blattamonas nauphoetae TaxID=2049346 RepID=A0ABQ9YMC3_9EUKA|nr:hypothetical protein BLNAU_199 [Blattamonas nauphoetae]